MSNKLPKCYIVIDDEKTQDRLFQDNVNKELSSFDLNYQFYDPKDFLKTEKEFEFDLEKLMKKIIEDVKGRTINAIVCDYNLGKDLGINGLEIIPSIKEQLSKAGKNIENINYFIHSANIEKALKTFLTKVKDNNTPISELIDQLDTMVSSKIQFISRIDDNYHKIISAIKKSSSTDDILKNTLSLTPDVVIRMGHQDFDGKTLNDVLKLIQKDDILGQKFVRDFIELSVAHFININE